MSETFQSIDLASDPGGDTTSELVKERKSKLLNRSISLTGYAVFLENFRDFLLFDKIKHKFNCLSLSKIRIFPYVNPSVTVGYFR